MLGHVESPPGHHGPLRRPPDPRRGRRPLRRAPLLGLQASRPATRPRARPRSSPAPDAPRPPRAAGGDRRPDRANPQGTHRRRLDAGAETIGWHLPTTTGSPLSRATDPPILTAPAWSPPSPRSDRSPPTSGSRPRCRTRPGSPTSPTTDYRPTGPGRRRDHHLARRLLPLRPARSAAPRSPPIVVATFREAADQHGYPASTLTDNGMVYTVRFAGGARAAQRLRARAQPTGHRPEELPSQPPHHLRQGRALPTDHEEVAAAQPDQPSTIAELQTLLDPFVDEYNHRRPHRSLPHRATPATAYRPAPSPPPPDRAPTRTHDRLRRDKIDRAPTLPLPRQRPGLHHISVGRTLAEPTSCSSSRTCTSLSPPPPPAPPAPSSSAPARTTSPPRPPPPLANEADARTHNPWVWASLRHHSCFEGRIRTCDLWVMSPASYRAAPPRVGRTLYQPGGEGGAGRRPSPAAHPVGVAPRTSRATPRPAARPGTPRRRSPDRPAPGPGPRSRRRAARSSGPRSPR